MLFKSQPNRRTWYSAEAISPTRFISNPRRHFHSFFFHRCLRRFVTEHFNTWMLSPSKSTDKLSCASNIHFGQEGEMTNRFSFLFYFSQSLWGNENKFLIFHIFDFHQKIFPNVHWHQRKGTKEITTWISFGTTKISKNRRWQINGRATKWHEREQYDANECWSRR